MLSCFAFRRRGRYDTLRYFGSFARAFITQYANERGQLVGLLWHLTLARSSFNALLLASQHLSITKACSCALLELFVYITELLRTSHSASSSYFKHAIQWHYLS